MTKRKIYLIIRSDQYHSKTSTVLMGVADKYEDAQKLYGTAIKNRHPEEVIHIYESKTGIMNMESILGESKKLVSSDSN